MLLVIQFFRRRCNKFVRDAIKNEMEIHIAAGDLFHSLSC